MRREALATRCAGARLSGRLRGGVCRLPDYRGWLRVPRLASRLGGYLVHALTQCRGGTCHGTRTVLCGVADAEVAALAHSLARR